MKPPLSNPSHFTITKFLYLLIISLSSIVNATAPPLDATVSESALRVLSTSSCPPRTGVLHRVPLPEDLRSSVEASVVRFRTGSLYVRGANFTHFSIPRHATVQPYASRVAVVYVNLHKYPPHLYDVPRYSVATPVVGLVAFGDDAAARPNGTRALSLSAVGNEPILVRFAGAPALNGTARCVRYAGSGFAFSDLRMPTTCTAMEEGYFAIVVPREGRTEVVEGKKGGDGGGDGGGGGVPKMWVQISCIAMVAMVTVAVVFAFAMRAARRRRLEAMERRAEEAESLDEMWVTRSSRMPMAKATRTRPVAMESEDGSFCDT